MLPSPYAFRMTTNTRWILTGIGIVLGAAAAWVTVGHQVAVTILVASPFGTLAAERSWQRRREREERDQAAKRDE